MADITININGSSAPTISTSTKTTLAAEETPESAALGRKIARDASGSEKALLRMLQEAGARVLRAYPAPNFGRAPDDRRDLLQVHVRFPDGTIGYFAPGGPPRQWSYQFIEGSKPGDENLPGVAPNDIGRVTGARENGEVCPCAHRHEGDKTVRPCAAKEAAEVAPVIYEAVVAEDVRWDKAPDGSTFAKVNGISYRVLKKGSRWELENWTERKSLGLFPTREAARCAIVKPKPAAEVPGPLASAAGAAVGTIAASALAAEEKLDTECLPWVKIGVDSAKYEACLAQANKLGPVTNAKRVYEIVHKEFHRRDQETFIILPCDIRGQLRYPPIEIAYGQRSRVAVGVGDVTRAAVASGAEYVVLCHGHPTGKAIPSKADRELTKAVEKALKENEIDLADHCVIGRGEVYSIRENKLHKI